MCLPNLLFGNSSLAAKIKLVVASPSAPRQADGGARPLTSATESTRPLSCSCAARSRPCKTPDPSRRRRRATSAMQSCLRDPERREYVSRLVENKSDPMGTGATHQKRSGTDTSSPHKYRSHLELQAEYLSGIGRKEACYVALRRGEWEDGMAFFSKRLDVRERQVYCCRRGMAGMEPGKLIDWLRNGDRPTLNFQVHSCRASPCLSVLLTKSHTYKPTTCFLYFRVHERNSHNAVRIYLPKSRKSTCSQSY